MRKQLEEVRYFLYSQAFADGLRTTFAILLPALLGAFYGWFDAGLAVALGALCVSLADAPGPLLNKSNGMIICALLLFFASALTALAQLNIYLLGIEIAVLAFTLSMFNVYGARAAGVGNAVLLMVILTLDKPIGPGEVLWRSGLVFFGGLWYLGISVLFSLLQPYRTGQRMLGDSIREISRYLSVKAAFYDPSTDLGADYQRLVAQQVIVHEKQDAVREILFKTRQIAEETTLPGRKLVMAFVETVDFFEDITAAYYDYASLRKRFQHTGILEKISLQVAAIATQLDRLGMAIQMNKPFAHPVDLEAQLSLLKQEIDALPKTEKESHLVLKKILVNLRRLVQHYKELAAYFGTKESTSRKISVDHSQFVTHQPLDAKIFADNLNLRSTVFRHSLRVASACLAGYILTKTISYGHHSYWILLTIAFIMKPAFSLTRQRNIERLLGTVGGGLVGVIILIFIPTREVQFAFMVLFMLLTYSFMRINYLAMVAFTTPFVLILFNFLGVGFIDLAKERIFDTVLGCAVAFVASTFLFPAWEAESIKTYLHKVMKANKGYLQLILEGLKGQLPDTLRYKLVRKEVYVSTANLAAAFQRMVSEPRNRQKNSKKIQQLIVQSHILFSNVATVATQLRGKELRQHPHQLAALVQKTIAVLDESIARLEGDPAPETELMEVEKTALPETVTADDNLLKDQLDFILCISKDIQKTVVAIAE